jgi:hypothetical protein
MERSLERETTNPGASVDFREETTCGGCGASRPAVERVLEKKKCQQVNIFSSPTHGDFRNEGLKDIHLCKSFGGQASGWPAVARESVGRNASNVSMRAQSISLI